MIRRLAAMLPLLLGVTAAEAAERRCGWFRNPTPANFYLEDRDGLWVLMQQGESYIPGLLALPDMRSGGWVATNGSYGYGCACLTMDVDHGRGRATRIRRAEPLPLERCRADRALPPP